jgi:hypothetical protein
MKANKDIRQYAKTKGVLLWEVAERLNINDSNFSRKLRKELPENEKTEIKGIIDSIANEKNAAATK